MLGQENSKRLVVISNRLPVEFALKEEGVALNPSKGGLVTALTPVLKHRNGMWIGWPGSVSLEDEKLRSFISEAGKTAGFSFSPVFLSKKEVNLYYLGFSNQVLWPLFHDFQGRCNFDPLFWDSYQSVNAKFAEVTHQNLCEDDFIWVHDYHLILLGQQLRQKKMASKIGFFLHIPFPSLDIFIKLPWKFQILSALLQYDLVGFQTHRDHRNFIQCVRFLTDDVKIKSQGSFHLCQREHAEIRVGTFPISIDYRDFVAGAASKQVEERAWLLHEKWPNQQLVFSLDRLDYTKGILQRLEAIRTFLTRFPEFHQKVCFVQVIVPSRQEVAEYRTLKNEVDRLVGEINSQFTQSSWVPINYIFRPLDRLELLAFYRTSEVALITPLKDGMNLVSKEYLACNIEEKGVLILSEFAGSAAQLHPGALLINPYDIEGLIQALNTALKMPFEERRCRVRNMCRSMRRTDVFWWVENYLNAAFQS